jgi:hypothetical protein
MTHPATAPAKYGEAAGPGRRIPLAAKLALTVFVALLIPVYLHAYGPTNFLYFCDVALMLTLAGMWLESPLLISMCSLGILLPQFLWLVDLGCTLVGIHLTGLTSYMFNHDLPLFTRLLSLYHGWLPLVLVWLLPRVGYDKRALPAWSAVATALVLICYFLMPPAGAHLANPNIPVNIDYVYGFNDQVPQHWMNQNLYVVAWIAVLNLAVFVPTHLVLRRLVRPATILQPK